MIDENRTTMRVILCRPDEMAEVIEMEDSLESMQKMVKKSLLLNIAVKAEL